MKPRTKKLLLIAFGLLLPLVCLALLEGAFTLLGIGDEALYDDPFVGFAPGSRLFEEKVVDGQRRYVTRPEKLAFFNAQSFPVDKEPGTVRVFTLGGSTTAGRPYDDALSFSNWLRLYLPLADPEGRYQIINAGGVSYASDRIALLTKELVKYQPDLFVLYTGHNEFLEERTYSEIIHQPAILKRLRMGLAGLRVAALARQAVRGLGQPETGARQGAEVKTVLDGWTGLDRFHRDPELEDAAVEHFEANLERIVSLARQSGAQILFVQPASNLRDFSPFKSEVGRVLSPEQASELQQRRATARALQAEDRQQEALADLKPGLELAPEHAELHFLAGKSLLALGRQQEAQEAFLQAKDLDAAPLRMLERLGRQIEAVARRRQVPRVDFRGKLAAENRRLLGHEIFGNEFFQDHVHPTVEVHAQLAGWIIEEWAAEGRFSLAASWTEQRRRQIYDRHLQSLDPAYYARRDMNLGKVLGWAGKLKEAEAPLRRAAEVLTEEPDVWLNLGILLQKTGRVEESVPALERAADLAPAWPLARFNLGVSYGRSGRLEESSQALEQAVALAPQFAEAWYNLGEVQASQGQTEAAEKSLRRALELEPKHAETLLALGRVLAQADRWPEAEPLLAQAQALAPKDPKVPYTRGRLLNRLGRKDEARQAYEAALALAPDHAPSLNNLGILAAEAGDLQQASERLIAAIRADPGYAEAYFNLGVVYENAGQPRQALQVLERAVQLAPEVPRFHHALGLLLQAQGRSAEAQPHLEAGKTDEAATLPQ